MLTYGRRRHLGGGELQTMMPVTLVLGNQAVLYVLRERRRLWESMASAWVLLSSSVDVAIVSTLARSGTLMAPRSWRLLAGTAAAAVALGLLVDLIKLPVRAVLEVDRR